MMTNLAKQLRDEEGEKLYAYQDHLGYWTIGVGRLIDRRKGGGITSEESAYLLSNDIRRKTADVDGALPWARSLDDARRAVLIGMAFQMGIEGLLKFRATLEHIRTGNYQQAKINMLKSLWAKQTPERAARMAEQMRTGEWQWKV